MTIRYECEECGSILKIKEDLAGKPGKCPKCKTAFTVPAPSEEAVPSETERPSDTDEEAHAEAGAPPSSGDFDVDAFLSGDDEDAPRAKPKSTKSKAPAREIDEDDFLSDEDDDSTKTKKTKSSSKSDDEVFQIRRSAEAPAAKYSLPPGIDDESEKPAPSRRPPGTSSAGTAANLAGDLLSKTGKKGKKAAWNEVEAQPKPESEFDWEGFRQYVLKQVLPIGGGIIALICGLYFGMSWMMGDQSSLPELGRVTGKVTIGGMPVVGADIWFHPVREKGGGNTSDDGQNKKKKSASSSVGKTDANGNYELMYTQDHPGAAVGNCRVQIEAIGRKDIPAQYLGDKSTAVKEVKSGRQVIDFDLSQ